MRRGDHGFWQGIPMVCVDNAHALARPTMPIRPLILGEVIGSILGSIIGYIKSGERDPPYIPLKRGTFSLVPPL